MGLRWLRVGFPWCPSSITMWVNASIAPRLSSRCMVVYLRAMLTLCPVNIRSVNLSIVLSMMFRLDRLIVRRRLTDRGRFRLVWFVLVVLRWRRLVMRIVLNRLMIFKGIARATRHRR